MRDWPSTLWPASFRGVPFFVESDQEHGGRRLAVHQFPGRDDPFIEDLGEDVREFQVTAYISSDQSDSESSALVANLTTAGGGVLVLPVQGSITARLRNFSRDRTKDRMGYIGFTLNFIREGAATALISSLYRAQLVFDAVASLATSTASAVARMLVRGQTNWVVDAAVASLQDIPATLETIRAGAVIDPPESLTIHGALSGVFKAIPDAVSPLTGIDISVVADTIDVSRTLAKAMPPEIAVAAFGAAIDDIPPPAPAVSATRSAKTSAANEALAQRLLRLTLITGYVEGLLAINFVNRPEGIAARAALVERFDVELANCIGAANLNLNIALQDLRAKAMTYFSVVIADLRPIITVTSQEPMPSLWWAWRLYQDPTQALVLVATNKIRNPSWMPQKFQTVAPAA